MKIVEKSLTETALEAADWMDIYIIEVNGEEKISVNDYGEPEDNSLGRDLNFVYGIVDLMRLAFEAGKAGEEFVVEQQKIEER